MIADAAETESLLQSRLASARFLASMGPSARTALVASIIRRHRLSPSALASDGGDADPRLLLHRLLLHLPRFSDEELNDVGLLDEEVDRRERELCRIHDSLPRELLTRRTVDVNLHAAVLEEVSPDLAGLVQRGWHYLATPRDGIHLGLYARTGGRAQDLLSLLTLSPLDVPHLVSILPRSSRADSAFVLSRLVGTAGIPANTITYMMGRAFSWLRENRPEVHMLLSYVNSNLGFQGGIYRASNWVAFAREPKKCIFYLDGDYVTDRELIRRFGTNDPELLCRDGGGHISTSRQPLQPLDVFRYFLHSPDRRRDTPRPAAHDLYDVSSITR